MQYTGRFAPSPTGPLHFGSLLAALASCLQARSNDGRWLLRMEDIDPPREQPGAAAAILRSLEAYGFEWDGPVIYQSRNVERHRQIVAQLIRQGLAYRCGCSRKDLAHANEGPLGIIYPGTCRSGSRSRSFAIRVRTHDQAISFRDLVQGPQTQRLEPESGDFVIQRRDRLIAYHLAVVVDDFDQGITQVVRGVDLLDSTPRHIHLQQLLDYRTPEYAHIPVAVNAAGQKLSKMTGAAALSHNAAAPTLVKALQALGQDPPQGLAAADLSSVWGWARQNWALQALAQRRAIPGCD